MKGQFHFFGERERSPIRILKEFLWNPYGEAHPPWVKLDMVDVANTTFKAYYVIDHANISMIKNPRKHFKVVLLLFSRSFFHL